MEKTITKRDVHDPAAARADRDYWLSRPPAERFEAVENLRRQYYGDYSERFQRVFHTSRRRKRDLADLEALGE